jgi:hypothetical protein
VTPAICALVVALLGVAMTAVAIVEFSRSE